MLYRERADFRTSPNLTTTPIFRPLRFRENNLRSRGGGVKFTYPKFIKFTPPPKCHFRDFHEGEIFLLNSFWTENTDCSLFRTAIIYTYIYVRLWYGRYTLRAGGLASS